jgi:hypothetical protein
MVKRTVLGALCAAVLLVTGLAQAQDNTTLTLRSGERVTGHLVDLGGTAYTVRVNNQERRIPRDDVAVIDFVGSTMSDADWAKFTGTEQVVLRNGQTINGHLVDIKGTTPKKLVVRTSTGDRELSSSEVSRIVMAKPSNVAATTGTASTPSTPGSTSITVPANQPWTPTGITVRKGETLTFNASGDVTLSADTNDVATPAGAKNGRYAPRAVLSKVLAGALIGRIGNGQPFGIGDHNTFQAPTAGQLFLGVNDDSFPDNQGQFQVTIQRAGTRP